MNHPSNHSAALIMQFNQQLSQSYEEINLLFRLSRLLNTTDRPDRVIQSACEQMARTLPFGWLAIVFRDQPHVDRALRGLLVQSAALPWPAQKLMDHSASLCDRPFDANWSGVLEPAGDPLAQSEILFLPIIHDNVCIGAIIGGNKSIEDSDISSGEMQIIRTACDFLGVYHANILRISQQKAQFDGTIFALSAAVDAKDPYTCGHSARVAELTFRLAKALRLSATEIECFRIAGQLHDVGKIGVSELVLCKAGKLSDDEFSQIKKHPEIGFRILKDVPGMAPMLPGILHHHEQWSGCGYPHRLSGEQIPLVAQCIALADSYDAMSSTRSYRRAMCHDEVLAEIRRCAGKQFNPALVEPFCSLDFADYNLLSLDSLQAA